MASMDVRPAYATSNIPVLQRKYCYGFGRFSVRIIIPKPSIYSKKLLYRQKNSSTSLRRAFRRPLALSTAGPFGSLLDTGIQLVKNLKPKIRASQDFVFGDHDGFMSNLMSAVSSFDVSAAAIGFVVGLSVYLSRFEGKWPQLAAATEGEGGGFAGDWILFTSPTPFNRFVVLRCPSILLEEGGAFSEDVNEKLTKDNVHYVKLANGAELSGFSCRGKIPYKIGDLGFSDVDDEGGGEFCYQRMCLSAEDGGVISLDWPASLDLVGEHGLDTTVLLVPGTAEGSNDEFVRGFVCKALQHGYFPVVMNPRGCAGSPLTTPRLFTAADSDDVCISARFIARLRPWSTLMGVGWGYGANMLTKYLAEAVETTPLTAAVCIGNPFDLEEAARSLSNHSILDKKLTEGLKDILRCNQVLFQGRRKGFDVASALSANSVREFEMAISRVFYGFDTIEDFYTKASSREIIGRVKIPTLFIQNDHVMAPIFSVPRNSIEDNPFTSLLLCSSMAAGHGIAKGQNSIKQWCNNLVIEWLEAVELSLLKGRHPLLKDIDISIKPTDDRLMINMHETQKHVMDSSIINSSKYRFGPSAEKSLDFRDREAFDSGVHMNNEDGGHSFQWNNRSSNPEMVQHKLHEHITDAEFQKGKVLGLSQETGSSTDAVNTVESESGEEGEVERGQALQTAKTVMRVLDVSMPGTLADEQKEQVLNAVGRGETLITALQSAVPEEVRGKLSAAVSGAVQARGINVKLDGLRKGASTSSLSMDMNSSSQEKIAEISKVKFDGTALDNSSNSSSHEHKASEGATEVDSDTTGRQEIMDIKSNDEGSGAHQSEETLENVGIEIKTEEKTSSSDSYVFESQTGVKSEDAEELKTPKLDSKIHEEAVGSSSLGKRTQEDTQQTPLKNELEQEKADRDNESTGKKDEQQKGEKLAVNEAHVDEQNKRKESTVEGDRKSASDQQLKRESIPDQKNDDKSISQGDKGSQNSGAKIDDTPPHVGMVSDEQIKGKESTAECDGKFAGEQLTKREETSDQKYEEKSVSSQEEQNKQSSNPKVEDLPLQGGSSPVQSPTINVKEAFDALTGFDDSTQIAVTNVFGVIENMINQLEKETQHKLQDTGPSGNKNQDQDHLQPQEGSQEFSEENGSEKRAEVPTIATNSYVSSENAGESFDIAQKGSVAGREEKLNLNLNQTQQQEIEETSAYKVKYSTSEVGDVHVQGVESQNAIARGNGKNSGVISVSSNRIKHRDKIPLQAQANRSGMVSFKEFPSVKRSPLTTLKNGPENTETINDLFLEYVPEEGQWKFLEQIESTKDSAKGKTMHDTTKIYGPKKHKPAENSMPMHVIEPSYVILNTQIDSDYDLVKSNVQNSIVPENEEETEKADGILSLVRNLILDTLRLEVIRRLGMSYRETLQFNLEEELLNVANAVALAVNQDIQRSGKAMLSDTENLQHLKHCREVEVSKLGPLRRELIVSAISSVLRGTYVLGRLIPVGVVVGACLAALRPIFIVVTGEEDLFDNGNYVYQSIPDWECRTSKVRESSSRKGIGYKFIDPTETKKQSEPMYSDRHQNTQENITEKNRENGGRVMVGAMTAALGATAAITSHQMKKTSLLKDNKDKDATVGSSLDHSTQRQNDICDDSNSSETEHEKVKPNIVSSLAEKAMSVAAPVVPTKEDGGVDHERLVAVLADLGQRGGALRLVGKVALLWGGLRGAMSLTDRLIVFFRIAERPLHQRILGFACMALLLWSPLVIPLLPTLLQLWSLHASFGVAGLASMVGLYGAHIILVTIWGKRIRGYDHPLQQYGLSLSSVSEILNLNKGVMIGLTLVISLYSTHILLGYAVFNLKSEFSFALSMGFVSAIKTCWRVSRLVLHAFGTGLVTATAEELLFRSWLHEEIASDLGFHKAVILSGIMFSCLHWSLPVMPGLWLLSVALSGARAKSNGNLSASVGLHAGLVAGNLIIKAGDFVKFKSNAPGWLTGAYTGNPFGGALGWGFLAVLAFLLYPWDGDPEAQKLQAFKKNQVFQKQCLGNTG